MVSSRHFGSIMITGTRSSFFLHNIGTISSIPSQSHYTQLCQTCPHIFFSNLFQIYGSHITHSLCSWQRSLAWFLINGTQVPFLHICLPIHYRICHICPNLFCKHTIQERMLPPSTHITWPVMQDAAGMQRNATSDEISSGSPTRPKGIRLQSLSSKISLATYYRCNKIYRK